MPASIGTRIAPGPRVFFVLWIWQPVRAPPWMRTGASPGQPKPGYSASGQMSRTGHPMILEMASRTRGECRWPWMTLDTSGVETPRILAKSPTLSLFSANRRRISLLFMFPFYSKGSFFTREKKPKWPKMRRDGLRERLKTLQMGQTLEQFAERCDMPSPTLRRATG